MSDFQVSTIIGRFVRAPEIKELSNDNTVANFTIATGEKWKDRDGQPKEETTFIRCTAWKGLAKVIGAYCDKGKQVLVSGKLKNNTWKDKDTGKDRTELFLKVEDVQLLGGKSDGQSTGGHSDSSQQRPGPSSAADEIGALDDDDSEPPF